jgi:hypothetical protein
MEIYRRMTAEQKLRLVFEANELNRALLRAGLETRYPEAGPEEIQRRPFGLLLGEELATRVYGPLDDHLTKH